MRVSSEPHAGVYDEASTCIDLLRTDEVVLVLGDHPKWQHMGSLPYRRVLTRVGVGYIDGNELEGV